MWAIVVKMGRNFSHILIDKGAAFFESVFQLFDTPASGYYLLIILDNMQDLIISF